MIIPNLIRALLEENSVTITGLGTFFVKKLPSHIKDDIIFPPQNIIEFEYSKEVEGFDFVSKLSKWEQIRIDEAQAQILKWLNLLETGLNQNKSIFFDDFGTFSKNETGQMVFQSVINFQLNIENEGLEPLIVHSKTNNIGIIDEPIKDKRIVLAKKTKKHDKVWFVLTILATAMLLCVLFLKDQLPDFYQTIFSKPEQAIAENDTTVEDVALIVKMGEDAIDSDIADDTNLKPDAINIEHTYITTTLPESKDIYLPYQEGKYYVIAGSFIKEEDALRHIEQKKLANYNAKLIVHPQNLRVRVCIGVFDNEKDADKFATQIDKNYWVLK